MSKPTLKLKMAPWIFILTGLLYSSAIKAQNYGNEWINTSQTYYRFSIPTTGLYRITALELQQAGITGSFSPQNIQLFYNGKEIPCYIQGESSGLTEYIEFYAEKNSGWFDVDMYNKPESQGNPYYSVITDTAAVFLTWNSSFNNLRYQSQTDINYNGYTPATYAYYQAISQYTNYYLYSWPGCQYLQGEGYVDASRLTLGATITRKASTPNFVSNTQPTYIDWSILSQSSYGHHLQVTGPGIMVDTVYNEYQTIHGMHTVSGQTLTSETSLSFTSVNDQGASTDYSSVAFISVNYPRNFNIDGLESYTFELPASTDKKSYIEFTNVDPNAVYLLYDLTHGYKLKTTLAGTLLKALIPASDNTSKIILARQTALQQVSEIDRITMVNYTNKNKERLIISHPKLWNAAENYAAYREAYLINVEELYNQFGYGIRKHPMAIRNFLHYAMDNWTIKPNSLFIIGDGVEALNYRNNKTNYANCLIPPMGYPGSDELLGSGFSGDTVASAIPIGRLAARNEQEVNDYLAKIQEFEQNEPGEWMKQICHFGGGITSIEQNRFKLYLEIYESIAEDSLFGGFVSTFLKQSSDPITISKSDSITNLINNGVSLMTFFGHGSTTGFDQNIDEPSAYTNKGKYPLIFANSCYSGNIFLVGAASASDSWILIPNKGAIAFLAMINQGIDTYLNIFAREFYHQFSYTSYAENLGTIINRTKKAIQTNSTPGYYLTSTIEEFTLHGDPWIVLNSFDKPDLTIEQKDVFFTPRNLSTEVDSFLINLVPTNISQSINQPFIIGVLRVFQDGSSEEYQQIVDGLLYRDTVALKLPIDFTRGQGNNQFLITLDIMNQVDELDETNNTLLVSTYISSADLTPIIPFKFGIWPDQNPTLKISTSDAFGAEQTSIIQIDTSYLFNSTSLVEEEITHTGGVITWNPNMTFAANKPYYWRAAKKTSDNSENWTNSSFILENNQQGWHQSAIGQMMQNEYKFIEVNESNQNFQFSNTPSTLSVHNIGSSNNYAYIRYDIDGFGDYGSCGAVPALIVAIIDSTNLEIWESNRGNYGHVNYEKCYSRTRYDRYFVFYINNESTIDTPLDNIVNLIENQVPDGHYFLIYSFLAGNYPWWKERHFQQFLAWGGSDNYRNLTAKQPFIFFSQKGHPEKAEEIIGEETESIDLFVELKTQLNYGTISSPKIGPSISWNQINWDFTSSETNSTDLAYVRLFSEDALGNLRLLKDTITSKNLDITDINAAENPYLRLQFYTQDEQNHTPAQLSFWEINYQPVTELAINTQRDWIFESDTLQEGANGKLALTYENLGLESVDSILVKYWIVNAKNSDHLISRHRVSPLEAGAWTMDTVYFKTQGLAGNNQIWVELNPENPSSKSYDQNEQYHFNNLAQLNFLVTSDETNPLLDVTFDGVHIMDGDLVSAKPEINIQLTDENPYLALDDTTLVSMYIKSQQTGIEEKIDLKNSTAITFVPASLPDNKAQILYQAEFPDDGTYELRVQAKDASGNESGTLDYQISFQVINESTITQVFNYPNPFSTSTRFVFELTGSQVPDELRIDILTITGKIVKVIYLSDLGLISIGKNISNFAWNGTDMYGDPLANGVYFYRVTARLNGETLKIRDTGTNQFFKNGFGKMYLMR